MFLGLQKDKVTVIKQNGERFENQSASVQRGRIFMVGSTLLIESGDVIERRMSNGGTEAFRVIDPGWHERHASIPAGYQMTVERVGTAPSPVPQSVTYNITGHNARINNQSVDHSTNVVGVSDKAAGLLASLRDEIQKLDAGHRDRALELVTEVDAQIVGGTPRKGVVTALLSALPAAGNIASIVAAIAALCQ